MSVLSEAQASALLAAIARGDESALERFYHAYQGTVYRYSYSRLNDAHAAADILTEVMTEVWKAAGRFAGHSKVSTWLLGIAHHKVVDLIRKRVKYEAEPLDSDIEDETPSQDLEGLMSKISDAKLLRKALQSLAAAHREILHLVFFEDLDYAEIAELLSVPEGTVKSRVFYAKSQLKAALAGM